MAHVVEMTFESTRVRLQRGRDVASVAKNKGPEEPSSVPEIDQNCSDRSNIATWNVTNCLKASDN